MDVSEHLGVNLKELSKNLKTSPAAINNAGALSMIFHLPGARNCSFVLVLEHKELVELVELKSIST